MAKYDIIDYIKDIDKKGLKETWHSILSKTLDNDFDSDIFSLDNYGELYEIGLAHENKISKKKQGKYYTPRDVALLMAGWLKDLDAQNVCDVGCGVGNLTLAYLDLIGKEKTRDLIFAGKLYLYDMDEIALEICKYTIAIKFGKDLLNKINIEVCDFLNKKVELPKNSKVISNPPYYKISDYGKYWNKTKVMMDSKELYSCFMEKIIKESDKAVIITPYSFIGGGKFYSLRKVMNKYNGFVISFDNVPGNIFNGRKYGIFNSNKGNSVRAAITVVENREGVKGFRFSPLLRFKTDERSKMLNRKYLENQVNDRYQEVNSKKRAYYKCHNELINVFDRWIDISDKKMISMISSKEGYEIYVPTTCRYFTVGSKRKLNRVGIRIVHVLKKEEYNYIYCMLNSTFAYWYWRLYDGGINCPLTIINSIPVFFNKLTAAQKKEIDIIAEEMQKNEEKYLTYKMNAGKEQENIKFPIEYRNRINTIFFHALGITDDVSIFNIIHSSSLFAERDGEVDED